MHSSHWWWAYTFPCQKFALFVSPFTLPVSPFTERSPLWRWNSQSVHTFHCQSFFAHFVPPLSNGTSRATSDRKPKTNDQILPSPILFFPSKKWIKLIPKTIGNRKRDCAWGTNLPYKFAAHRYRLPCRLFRWASNLAFQRHWKIAQSCCNLKD